MIGTFQNCGEPDNKRKMRWAVSFNVRPAKDHPYFVPVERAFLVVALLDRTEASAEARAKAIVAQLPFEAEHHNTVDASGTHVGLTPIEEIMLSELGLCYSLVALPTGEEKSIGGDMPTPEPPDAADSWKEKDPGS